MPLPHIEIISNGITDIPTILINQPFDFTVSIDEPTNGVFVFDASADVTVNTHVTDFSISQKNDAQFLTNFGIIGGGDDGLTSGDIKFGGTGTHVLVNNGEIIADIQMGNAQDHIHNFGLIDGQVRMGAGDDYFINDSATEFAGDQTGLVTGMVNMGSGDDVVLNAATMGRVNLGSGNDAYVAIHPQDSQDNFTTTLSSAARVSGGTGDDTMFGGSSDDRFYGGQDNDLLNGHNGNDKLYGGQGQDILNGGNDNDRLFGGDSKDRLNGGNGNDMLNGGTGEDILIGGRGNDRMYGGSGADTFVFAGNTDADVIMDFDVEADVVRLQDVTVSTGDGDLFGVYGDDFLLSFVSYGNGNAVLDLSELYKAVGFGLSNADGIQITFKGVEEGSLTGDNFITPQDLHPFPDVDII